VKIASSCVMFLCFSRYKTVLLPMLAILHHSESESVMPRAVRNFVLRRLLACITAVASYTDYEANSKIDNLYIYNPRAGGQDAYVSPRSLERASFVVKARDTIDSESLIASLTGAIGEAASRDMQAFVEYQDQLPSWESIIAEPKKAKLPTSAGACAVLVFGAIAKIEKTNIAKFMEYLARMDTEWQACFCIQVSKNQQKQMIAFSSKAFADWTERNADVI